MRFFVPPRHWTDMAVRISVLIIYGPALYLLIALSWKPDDGTFARMGWLLLLLGISSFAVSTTIACLEAIANPTRRGKTTETDLGLISLGLAFASPSTDLAFYFGGLAVLGALFTITNVFVLPIVSKRTGPPA